MKLTVELSEKSYDIIIERGALKKIGDLLPLGRRVLVVTDSGVPSEYAKTVADAAKDGYILTLPQGEENKNLGSFELILSALLEHSFTRTDCVVAVGGGVVGDMAGFAAACYMRGIDFYNIPTTLLSEVDSSIGGKTAVDYKGVKNIVGAFYQPKRVVIDPDTLKTLSARHISAGLAEAIKMAATSDAELFEAIRTGIYVDEACPTGEYVHKKRAEYLERAIYICPKCGLSKHVSRDARVACTVCGNVVTYGTDKTLSATMPDFPFRYAADWYNWQKDYINAFDPLSFTDSPIFTDTATLSEVIPNEKKVELCRETAVSLYGDRVVIDEGKESERVFDFETVSAFTVLGRNKLNIYVGKQIFQLHGDKRFNALKYVHIYNRTKNIRRGDSNGQFLGL